MSKSKGSRPSRIWLALLALLPLGCTVRHVPVLELHRSELVTPAGRVPLEIATERHMSTFAVNTRQRLIAKYGSVWVRVGVLPGSRTLIVDHPPGSGIGMVEGESYYQLNGGERIPVEIQAKRTGNQYLYFELPLGLSDRDMIIAGGTLVDATVARIEAREDDVHTFYMPFTVNGEPFAVDLEFSIGIDTSWVMAAPATP